MGALSAATTLLLCMTGWAGGEEFRFGRTAADTPGTEEKPLLVRHGERPLRASDFLALVPEDLPESDPPLVAYSHTEVRYAYNTQVSRRRNRVRLQLNEIELFAVFVGDKSWNDSKQNGALLDHHQGHLDLAQIASLELQQEFDEALRKERQSLVGEGGSEQEAQQDLQQKIEKRMLARIAQLEQEHKYFDENTRYGTDAEAESRERRKQLELLQALTEARKK
jgi:hypothetical protein